MKICINSGVMYQKRLKYDTIPENLCSHVFRYLSVYDFKNDHYTTHFLTTHLRLNVVTKFQFVCSIADFILVVYFFQVSEITLSFRLQNLKFFSPKDERKHHLSSGLKLLYRVHMWVSQNITHTGSSPCSVLVGEVRGCHTSDMNLRNKPPNKSYPEKKPPRYMHSRHEATRKKTS